MTTGVKRAMHAAMGLGEVLKAVMEQEAADRAARPRRFGFSDASFPCLRKLYRDKAVGPGIVADLRSVFGAAVGHAVGTLMEKAAAARLGMCAQLPVLLDTADPVAAEGHLDLYDPKENEVIDIKVVGEPAWDRILREKAALPQNVAQVNGYAAAQGAARWVLYYLRGVSIFAPGELEWRVFRGATNPEKARGINLRWALLQEHIEAKTEPYIPAGYSREKFPCGWCGHQDYCFPEPVSVAGGRDDP